MEENFWQEKSKVKWHTDGDRNTSYFHKMTKIRHYTKLISSIQQDEEVYTEPENISRIFTNHFEQLFTTNNACVNNCLVDEAIPNLIFDQANATLTIFPSNNEIKNAVFDLSNDSPLVPTDLEAFYFNTIGKLSRLMR
ncbi:unnamed protein product [Lathyrus sativus]|nr:unnamed protein product [Lathyrus sativus]